MWAQDADERLMMQVARPISTAHAHKPRASLFRLRAPVDVDNPSPCRGSNEASR